MKKKVVIIVVAVVVALALLITGTILLLSSKFTNAPDKDTDSQSSITSSDTSTQEGDILNDNSKPSTAPSANSGTNGSPSSSTVSTPSVPTVNSNVTTVIVDNVTANKGGKVSVPVYVSSNKGFMGVIAKFQYDTSALKYTGYKKGNILTDYELQESNGLIKFLSIENGDITKDGIMVYLEFDVISSSAQVSPVKVSIDKTDIANKAEQYVDVQTVNGSVTIK